MDQAGLETAVLTSSAIDDFLAARRAAGYTSWRTLKALGPLLEYLRGLGVIPPVSPAQLTPAEELLERYRGYLLTERGLTAETAHGYINLVRPFVSDRVHDDGLDRERVTAAEITGFLVDRSRRLSPKATQWLASALRSLLSFWHLDGVIAMSLTETVPKVANRRPGLPRALEPAQVDALLASCDRGSADGLRDFAMLTMPTRLGLRAGEVAGLQLDDLDWRRGLITIRGKGNRRDLLPLPVDVGQRIAVAALWRRRWAWTARWPGRRYPPRAAQGGWDFACRWCAASPPTCIPSIHRSRSRRLVCCRARAGARFPTCIPTTTSLPCSRRPNGCARHCAGRPCRRSSG